jgi:hypothetical protein
MSWDANRSGFDVRGNLDVFEEPVQPGNGIVEMRAAISEVAAQGDSDPCGHR